MSLDDYWEAILDEWGEQGNMHAMWLPRTFREGRAVYMNCSHRASNFPIRQWFEISRYRTYRRTLESLRQLSPLRFGTISISTTARFLWVSISRRSMATHQAKAGAAGRTGNVLWTTAWMSPQESRAVELSMRMTLHYSSRNGCARSRCGDREG